MLSQMPHPTNNHWGIGTSFEHNSASRLDAIAHPVAAASLQACCFRCRQIVCPVSVLYVTVLQIGEQDLLAKTSSIAVDEDRWMYLTGGHAKPCGLPNSAPE